MVLYNYILRSWYNFKRKRCRKYQFTAINCSKQRHKYIASLEQLTGGHKSWGINKRIKNYLQYCNSNCRNAEEKLKCRHHPYIEADGDTYMYEAWSDDLDVKMEDVYQLNSSPLYTIDFMDVDEGFNGSEEEVTSNYNILEPYEDMVLYSGDGVNTNLFNEIEEQQVLIPPLNLPIYKGLITSRPSISLPTESDVLLETQLILSQVSLSSSSQTIAPLQDEFLPTQGTTSLSQAQSEP